MLSKRVQAEATKFQLESAMKESEIKKKTKLQCKEAEIEAELELCASYRL